MNTEIAISITTNIFNWCLSLLHSQIFWNAASTITALSAAIIALRVAEKSRKLQAKMAAHSKKQHIAERVTAKVLTLKKDANVFEVAVKRLIEYAKAGKLININFYELAQLSSFPNDLEIVIAYVDLYFEYEKVGYNWNKASDLILNITKISSEIYDLTHEKIADPNLAELMQVKFNEFLNLKNDLDKTLVDIRNFLVDDLEEFNNKI